MAHPIAFLFFLAVTVSTALTQDYVVVSGDPKGGTFYPAAKQLASHHKAELLTFEVDKVADLAVRLRKLAPRHVAYVLRPDQLDYDLARQLLQMATEIDADPFVDFAYGFFTGATGAETMAFVERSIAFAGTGDKVRYGRVAGGVPRSSQRRSEHRLRESKLDTRNLYVAGKKAFPEEGHDRGFVRAHLPGLQDCNLLMFIGHGVPREIVGGPDWKDLAGLKFPGAVVLNVGCYTGVTGRYFTRDWRKGDLIAENVPPEESFALGVLRSGVIGYTAYTCPRPAGPELDTDLAYLVADGLTLGGARRRDYDKTVLGFMGFGEKRLQLARLRGGTKLAPVRDAVRDLMLEGATGGVLFGDPALAPFPKRPGDAPTHAEVVVKDGHLAVTFDCPAASTNLVCNDPTARLGRFMALKAYMRLDLGQRFVRDVVVDRITVAGRTQESSGLVWALEEDRGRRFAQVKVMVERPKHRGALRVELRVKTCPKAEDGKAMGGSPPAVVGTRNNPRRAPARNATKKVDLTSTKITPAMRQRLKSWEVSEAALQDALHATRATLTRRDTQRVNALAQRDTEGFRALCLLLELGHHHYRTVTLLERTYRKGAESHLMRLTELRPLPRFADWTLLDALGLAATPTTKQYLLKAQRQAKNAGVFASSALGLGRMQVTEAVPAIAQRLQAMSPRDRGVHKMLIQALGRMGGDAARQALVRYAETDGAFAPKLARRELDKAKRR